MVGKNLSAAMEYKERGFSVIPVRPRDKKPDLIKWDDFKKRIASDDEIKAWWKRWPDANVGIVTGLISGIAVIDVDDIKEAEPVLNKILPIDLVIPTATTPRGGKHLYFKCLDAKLENNVKKIPGCDLRANGGMVVAPPSITDKGSYAWLEGHKIGAVTFANLPTSYLDAIKKKEYIYTAENDHNEQHLTTNDHKNMFTSGRRDNDLFHTANCLAKGGMPDDEITKVLEHLILSWGEAPDPKWINAKVLSAFNRIERRDRNLADEVRSYILTTNGYFSTTNCHNELQVTTRQDKKTVNMALLRSSADGILERHRSENGKYRRVETEAEIINFSSAEDTTIDIKWPFELEQYALTMPKNIIVVAGAPNAGKTAFLLNVVDMNQDKHDIHYFSSEMGALELKSRLKKFDRPLSSWKFTPYERSEKFADVIKPDAVNIIDYLEIHTNLFEIGAMIKEIFDKLKNGIAIIAIQKKPGSDAGYGGVFSLEKPRLYITLDNGKLKIAKAKNWTDEMCNPNKLTVKYSLVKGCKFLMDSGFEREYS